jgi:hypothetical protein
MSYVNPVTREVNVKVVWLVPAGGLASARALHAALAADIRPELSQMPLDTGQVLYFAFAPKTFAGKTGYALRIHLFATDATADEDRGSVARSADAVVLVDLPDDVLPRAGLGGIRLPTVRGASRDSPAELLKQAARQVIADLTGATAAGEPEPVPGPRPAKPEDGSKWLPVGPYLFHVPAWCTRAAVHDAPPFHRLEGVAVNQVSLTVGVVVGQGTQAEVDRCLDQLGPAWKGERTEQASLVLEGIALEGFRVHGASAGDLQLRLVEAYVGVCGPDLLLVNVLYGGDGASDVATRHLFVAMITGAILRRMSEEPDLFRRPRPA